MMELADAARKFMRTLPSFHVVNNLTPTAELLQTNIPLVVNDDKMRQCLGPGLNPGHLSLGFTSRPRYDKWVAADGEHT
jgi:hypothetical protein